MRLLMSTVSTFYHVSCVLSLAGVRQRNERTQQLAYVTCQKGLENMWMFPKNRGGMFPPKMDGL